MNRRSNNHAAGLLKGAALVCAVIGVALGVGCRGERSDKPPRQFFPDMDQQPRWNPQSESDFFVDGRTMRQPVMGTVPFGRAAIISRAAWATTYAQQRADLLKDDDAVYFGVGSDGDYLRTMPVPVTRELIDRGQARYNIYCVVCHGFAGDGKGMVGQRWSYPLPSFHDAKFFDPEQVQSRDGYLFHTAREGFVDATGAQKMPGYAHAVNEHDAWAIVAYIRTLQASRSATLDDVAPAQRDQLMRMRPAGGTP